mmetsp:Transcript_21609/g.47202  ORF Transcript_21609/g.47202 Transcript_21609/m.47202 type:complete len:241 (+) Transcript_21609:361-1083(+)
MVLRRDLRLAGSLQEQLVALSTSAPVDHLVRAAPGVLPQQAHVDGQCALQQRRCLAHLLAVIANAPHGGLPWLQNSEPHPRLGPRGAAPQPWWRRLLPRTDGGGPCRRMALRQALPPRGHASRGGRPSASTSCRSQSSMGGAATGTRLCVGCGEGGRGCAGRVAMPGRRAGCLCYLLRPPLRRALCRPGFVWEPAPRLRSLLPSPVRPFHGGHRERGALAARPRRLPSVSPTLLGLDACP